MTNLWDNSETVRAELNQKNFSKLIDAFVPEISKRGLIYSTDELEHKKYLTTWLSLTPKERITLIEAGDRKGPFGEYLSICAHALLLQSQFHESMILYDDMVVFNDFPKEVYCNALYVVQNDNSKLGVMPERAKKYLETCLIHGPKNPAIFYNAAAVLFELGDIDGTIENIRLAAKYNYKGLKKIRDEKGFIPLRRDPRFYEIFSEAKLDPPVWDDLKVALDHSEIVYNLSLSDIETVPEEIKQFENLQILEIHSDKLYSLPPWITEFTQLRKFNFDWCSQIKVLPNEILAMPSLQEISFYGSSLPKKYQQLQINNLLSGFAKTKASKENRLFHLALLLNDESTLHEQGTLLNFIQALDSNLSQVRSFALRHMSKKLGDVDFSLSEGGEILVVGKLNVDLPILKDRLKRNQMSIGKKLNSKTIAIVIGQQPKCKDNSLLESGKPIILEAHLQKALDQIETPYLIEEANQDQTTAQKLGSLLSSPDIATIRIAISMMKNGGVPSNVFEELFLVFQNTEYDKQTRNDAKKLFEQYAPIELRDALTNVFLKTSVFLSGESKLTSRLKKLEKEAGKSFDCIKLATLLLQKRRGIKFLFEKSKRHSSYASQVLESIQKGNSIDLSALEITYLPQEISKVVNLKKLNISNNHFREIPEVIFELSQLTDLDVSSMRLSEISPDIKKLTQLTCLDASHNFLQKFPDSILSLNQLKTLVLSTQKYGRFFPWKILPDEICNLINLEILKLHCHQFVSFPDSMRQLSALEVLDLSFCELEHLPEWLTELPSLKELHLVYTKVTDTQSLQDRIADLGAKGVTITR